MFVRLKGSKALRLIPACGWNGGCGDRQGADHGGPQARANQHHLHPEYDGQSSRGFKQGNDVQICVESGWEKDGGVGWRRWTE